MAFEFSAAAQGNSSTVPFWAKSTFLAFLFLQTATCRVWADVEVYYEPGINPYREQISQDGLTSVDPYTGALKLQHVDLVLPGNGGLDIKIMRTYDSARVALLGVGGWLLSPIGNGWIFHFGSISGYKVCDLSATTTVARPTVQMPDGDQFRLYKAPAGFGHLYTSKEGWAADCVNTPSGEGLQVMSPDGLQYEMTVKGIRGAVAGENVFYVKKITDKNGNWLNFDYQVTSNRAYVQKVTASDGRTVDFIYNGSGGLSGERLTAITVNGQSWLFSYALSGTPISPTTNASNFELASVTRPDGRVWSYEYPTFASYYSPFVIMKGYLGQITRPDGGAEKYTYTYLSSGVSVAAKMLRVTRKAVQDNVNPEAVWDYRYKFWENDGSSVGVSITDVADSAGRVTTYKHETPYLSSTAQPWRIGLLLDKLTCSSNNGALLTCTPQAALSREQFEWGSQMISPDPDYVSTAIELYTQAQTSRPLLTKRTITRDGTVYITQHQSHDAYGNPAKIVETGNGTTRTTDLTYFNDPAKWITGVPDKETVDGSWIIDRSFDANGNVLSLSKYGVTTTYKIGRASCRERV